MSFPLSMTGIGLVMSLSYRFFAAVSFSSVSCPSSFVCVLRGPGVSGDAIEANLGTEL